MNIVDLISFKGDIAFLERKGYGTYSVSYKKLKEKMLKTETYLRKKGVKKGNKVLIQAPNCVDYVVLMLACLHLGIIVVPLDPFTSSKLRKKIIKEVKPKLVFTDFSKFESLVKNLPPNTSVPKISGENVAEIIYTSGTTGVPKGVVLTHENICSNIRALQKGFNFKLKHISVLPLSHMLEQSSGLFLPLTNNSTILYPSSARYSDLIDLIRYKKINAMTAVPGILEGLKKAMELRGKSLRKLLGWHFWVVGVGGATLNPELEDWWRKKILLLQGYGLSETSPIVSINLPFKKRKYSLGKSLENVSVRIKNNEIQVKGPNVMLGYYNKPEKTKESFDGGWFKTGDLGEIRNNYLYFKGREKDIIVTKAGLNVYPEDIEKELNKYVKESCVIEKEGTVHAVVVIEKGNIAKIVSEVNKELEPHQKIFSFTLWKEDFPKTLTGKIKRFEVKERIKHHTFPKPKSKLHALLASSLNKQIKNIPLTSLGMDSLKRMEILSLIEENYGIELNESDITVKTTPKDLEKLIEGKRRLYRYDFRLPKLNFLGHVVASGLVNFFCRIKCNNQILFKGLIVSNHVSVFDTPVLTHCLKGKYAVATLPEILGIGKTTIKNKVRGFFIRHLFNAYPFGPEVGLENSLRFTAHLLDEGYSVIIFPEGRMTRDGKIHEFKGGAGFLSVNMGVEVLPVKIEGLFSILPYGKFWPKFGKVIVKMGKQFKVGKMAYFRATKLIEKKVKGL